MALLKDIYKPNMRQYGVPFDGPLGFVLKIFLATKAQYNFAMKRPSVQARMVKEKKLMLEQLERTPNIQIACGRVGIGRATHHRWCKNDAEYGKKAEAAITEGVSIVNDLAESQLITAIREKDMRAITLWLKKHHPTYMDRPETVKEEVEKDRPLTEEENALVCKILGITELPEMAKV
jgi:cobalamin biosynthesis protein CobT